jgi:hypothetical protein
VENGMGIADRPWREFFLDHFVVHSLELKRCKVEKFPRSQCWPDIPVEQRGVVLEGLRSELGSGGELEPAVEVLVQGDLGALEVTGHFALGQPAVEKVLGSTEGTAEGAARVAAPAG